MTPTLIAASTNDTATKFSFIIISKKAFVKDNPATAMTRQHRKGFKIKKTIRSWTVSESEKMGSEGLGPPNPKGSGFTVRRNCRYANSPKKLLVGLGPTTPRLQITCSTN